VSNKREVGQLRGKGTVKGTKSGKRPKNGITKRRQGIITEASLKPERQTILRAWQDGVRQWMVNHLGERLRKNQVDFGGGGVEVILLEQERFGKAADAGGGSPTQKRLQTGNSTKQGKPVAIVR